MSGSSFGSHLPIAEGGFSHCLGGHDYCDNAGKGDKEDRHA